MMSRIQYNKKRKKKNVDLEIQGYEQTFLFALHAITWTFIRAAQRARTPSKFTPEVPIKTASGVFIKLAQLCKRRVTRDFPSLFNYNGVSANESTFSALEKLYRRSQVTVSSKDFPIVGRRQQ